MACSLTGVPFGRISQDIAPWDRAETRAALGRREEAGRGVCRIRSLGGGRCPPPTTLAAKPRRSPFGERIGPASPQDTSGVGGLPTTEDDGMRRVSARADSSLLRSGPLQRACQGASGQRLAHPLPIVRGGVKIA